MAHGKESCVVTEQRALTGAEKTREWRQSKRGAGMNLYWANPEEKAALMELSREQGYASFTDWIRQMVRNGVTAASTSTEYVAQLKRDVERLRVWVEQKDQQIEDLRRQLREADLQKEDLRVVLAGLAHLDPKATAAIERSKGGR